MRRVSEERRADAQAYSVPLRNDVLYYHKSTKICKKPFLTSNLHVQIKIFFFHYSHPPSLLQSFTPGLKRYRFFSKIFPNQRRMMRSGLPSRITGCIRVPDFQAHWRSSLVLLLASYCFVAGGRLSWVFIYFERTLTFSYRMVSLN